MKFSREDLLSAVEEMESEYDTNRELQKFVEAVKLEPSFDDLLTQSPPTTAIRSCFIIGYYYGLLASKLTKESES